MNLLISLISGILLSISWPTYGIPFLLFFSFVPLFILENRISESNKKGKFRKTFFYSYFAFLIWNIVDTWWIYYSTLEGMLLAVILNSLFMTTVFVSYSYVKRKKGIILGAIFFIVAWISFEKLHHYWDLNWPWLSLGNAFSEYPKLIQWYEYTGIFGGTLWVLIVNILIFKTYLKYVKYRDLNILKRKSIILSVYIFIPILISLIIYHTYEIDDSKNITSIVVQPNVDPYKDKFKMGDASSFDNAISCVEDIIDTNVNFIFLPETTLPNSKSVSGFKDNYVYNHIVNYLKKYPKTTLISGSTFIDYHDHKYNESTIKSHKGYFYNLYNSSFQANSTDTVSFYHKSKLVPGVEVLPFEKIILPIIGDMIIQIGGISGSHTRQEKRKVYRNSINDIRIAPSICYESIYGEFMSKYIKNGANHIVIITNDAWWNDTQGHKQHFSYAKLRAIENRKSISRSANTGISGFINEKGDVLKTLSYGSKGAIKMTLPINNKITFYAEYGDYIARFSIFIMIAILFSIFFRKKKLI